MVRDPDHLCLLCKINFATQKNSHIIPKFLAKPILGENKRKASYTINPRASRIVSKPEQDSPKENYILCPKCEKYFENLETYVSQKIFYPLRNNKVKENIDIHRDEGGKEQLYIQGVNTQTVCFFLLSLFWRCSISSIPPFQGFKLPNSEEFRRLLYEDLIRKDRGADILRTFNEGFSMPLIVFKVKEDHDHTENLIYPVGNEATGLWQIMVDDMLFWYCMPEHPILKVLEPQGIHGNEVALITLVDLEFWRGLKQFLFKNTAALAIESLKGSIGINT